MTGDEPDRTGTLLGFDFGLDRIGVAVGQRLTGTARPLRCVAAVQGKPDWSAITVLIETWQPRALVVGIPYNMDGSSHELTDAARRFQRQLQGRYGLTVYGVDERLTSLEAERLMAAERAEGKRRHKIDKEDVDMKAAQLILESWLKQ